jgi:cation transport regulator
MARNLLMPYASTKDLPTATRGLPEHAKEVFRAAFNAAHQQSPNDEAKAFRIAWAAAKKVRKKQQDDPGVEEGTPMRHLLEQLRRLVQSVRVATPDLDQAKLAEAETLLKQEPADDTGLETLCRSLEQAMGGYMYRPGAHFEGSLEERLEVLCSAIREQGIVGRYGFIVTVFPDYLIACDPGDDYGCYCDADESPTYWKLPYTLADDNTNVQFGERVEVELQMVAVEVGDAGAEAEQSALSLADLFQATVTKKDGDHSFGAGAYLIVPDKTEPSTWKVRVEETPGKVTVQQLGAAHAALTKGFRGNKVSAASGDVSKAMTRLKGLYKKLGAAMPGGGDQQEAVDDQPDWLIQGQDPPGGSQVLQQAQSCLLQAIQTDDATGVMTVRGVATTGDVLNAMKQVYPWQVWQDNEPRLQRLLQQGKLVGEAMHPEDGRASLDRTCMKFTKIWLDQDDKQIKFEADLIPTEPHGKNLQLLIQNGVSVDISSRGKGEFAPGNWHGTPAMIVQRGFRCDGFDCVISGASPGSTITDWSLQSDASSEDTEEEPEMKDAGKDSSLHGTDGCKAG